MPRDTKPKRDIKKDKHAYDKQQKKKNNDDDNDEVSSSDNEDDVMGEHELRTFISRVFPSKHLDNKIKAGERLKSKLNPKSSKKKVESEKDEESDEEEESEEDEDSDDEEDEWETASEEETPKKKKSSQIIEFDEKNKNSTKGSNVNITFTIGGLGNDEDSYDEDYDEDEDEDESVSETENEDESVSTDSSSQSEDEEEEDAIYNRTRNKSLMRKNLKPQIQHKQKQIVCKNKKETKSIDKETTGLDTETTINCQVADKDESIKNLLTPQASASSNDIVTKLKEILDQNKHNKMAQKCIDMCEDELASDKKKQDKKIAKTKAKNLRIFKRKVNDKNVMNDFAFYSKLDVLEQRAIIKELREVNKIIQIEKPYRMTLLESNMPIVFKGAAMKKINALRHMDPGSGEFYKIKNWIDAFMRIPFNIDQSLTINIDDGVDKCHQFMENAQTTLNQAVYGLNDAKMQIMQMLGQLVTNPKSIGTAIAIHGPPGTGKTSLVKEGISKILNRPFAFIALGGATDSSFLEGHSYTYEGSTWGKIVQILIDSKCMNPVIYFDELDKISDTPRGEEIAGILTHLTDTSQNSQFHDKYFAEIDFDLSKCLFIFSYNDETKINPILKDRMYRIQTKGYDLKQKTVIGNDYLLPRIREQVKFEGSDIIMPDETIRHIIENHCNKEAGVRNLKRCLEIIHTKLNLYRLMKPDSNLFEEDMSLKVTFPFTVTKDIVDKLIKYDAQNTSALYSMYV
jgi:ATP-dependent Lon protease